MKLSPSSVLLMLTPLLFASCKSSRTTASGSTSTPSHNMSRKDYPFDENGNYHEEWARGDDSRSVVDLTKDNPTSVFVGTKDARDEEKPPTKTTASARTKPKPAVSKPTVNAKPKATSKPKTMVKAKPKPPQATVITVKKGDTLYSLAQRYKTTVQAIQSANGLGSSTALRDGRSLKIPR